MTKQITHQRREIQVTSSLEKYWKGLSREVTSINDVITKDTSMGLRSLRVRYEPEIYAFIAQQLGDLIDFISVTNTPFKGESGYKPMKELIDLILSEYPTYKLSDIYLIFRNAKLGAYGTFFNRLDGLMILSWFKEYDEDRSRIWHENKAREEERIKTPPTNEPVDKEGIQKLIKLYERMAHKSTKKNRDYTINVYHHSIEDWARANGYDPKESRREFDEEFEDYMKVNPHLQRKDKPSIYQYRENLLLHRLQKTIR